jgi:predicted RecA/RadA family phage recombinase
VLNSINNQKRWLRTMKVKAVRRILMALACAATIPLGGCVAVALTALGVGMATGVSHTLGGIVYKTFSLPQARVKKAALAALVRMQVNVLKVTKDGATEVILAKAGDREVEVELEALTGSTTRMSVTVKKDGGLLRDSATATEIILQTERLAGTN